MTFLADTLGKMGIGHRTVVAIKTVASGTETWSEDKFLPGDVVEQLRLERQIVPVVVAPFSGGKTGLIRELRKLANVSERIYVRICRRARKLEISACVVAEESVLRKHYALADFEDRNYIVSLVDATEEEYSVVQDQSQRILEERGRSRISNVQLKDCLISYSWQQKMKHFLPSPNSAIVFSLLVMPFQPSRPGTAFNDVDDTSARATAWLSASQKVGVPIIFVNIQTEPILRQNSSSLGHMSQEDASSVASSGSYIVHDEAGTDVAIIRGIRLWYAPAASELALNLIPDESERLGVSIRNTEEGFCYVSSVECGTSADRAGLKQLYEAAGAAGKLLVISRVAGQKVTPWMVQSSGAIRCFDTLLISEILSLHKQSSQPIQISVMLWNGFALARDEGLDSAVASQNSPRYSVSKSSNSPSQAKVIRWSEDNNVQSVYSNDGVPDPALENRSRHQNAESARRSTGSPRNSTSHCSVRYFNVPDSSGSPNENEDFSFSF